MECEINLRGSGDMGLLGWLRRRLANYIVARLSRIPRHIAIIPDGNRRWARRRGLPPWMGHVYGYHRMRVILDFLWKTGVSYVTVYALSRENCVRRPREERLYLYAIIGKAVRDLLADSRVSKGDLRVYITGDFSLLPNSLRSLIEDINYKTAGNGPRVLCVGLCYSGRWEIVEAVRRTSGSPGLSEEELARNMALGWLPEPDLVVRTGGEMRISNFLLWHIAYSELYFTKKLWPDFDELDMARALAEYQRRERRFGR